MKKHFYRAFDLIFESEIPCPALEAVEPQPSDVSIVQASLDDLKDDHQIHGVPGRIYYHIPGVVTFDIRDGKTILIDLSDCDDQALAQLYLTGSAIGTILHQRKLLVLHGNAIALNDQEAVIFVGPSGVGKSTIANAFMKAGFEILTDDVSAIEFDESGRAWVLPAYPSIKLWQDVAQRDYDIHGLAPIANRENKFYVQTKAKFCHSKRQVKAIYGLEAGVELQKAPLSGADAFEWLHQQIYRPYFVHLLNQQTTCFKQIGKLAKACELYRLKRPLNFCHDKTINLVTKMTQAEVLE